jgi:N-ethylmaleimide reductase
MLFTPYRLGNLELPNRIVMPPMTRSRAGVCNVPTALMAEYYAQRASAGLIVTGGTQISQQGQGYAWTPGHHRIQTPLADFTFHDLFDFGKQFSRAA